MAPHLALVCSGEGDGPRRVGLRVRRVDGEPEHGRQLHGQVGLDPVEQVGAVGAGRIEPVVLDGPVILPEGVAERRGLLVERSDVVGPVRFWRGAEGRQRLHGGAQKSAGVAGHAHEVARGLVQEQAGDVHVPSSRVPLESH